MGAAWEILNGFVTNPGATITAVTMAPGDSLAVRNFPDASSAYLENLWALSGTAGVVRVRSPRLHDNVQGIRFRTVAAANRLLLGEAERQLLYAQDVLILEQSGGAAESDACTLLIRYLDVGGVAARLIDSAQLTARWRNLFNIEVAVGAGAAIGTYATPVAVNATFDLTKANTDYAIIGYETDTAGVSVGIKGVDTGNLRIGGPMTTERIETRDLFQRLSDASGMPMMPVINAANKGATFVDTFQNVVGLAANITLICAELAP
jgi:hypothetical protein